jgi:hypothetical protein
MSTRPFCFTSTGVYLSLATLVFGNTVGFLGRSVMNFFPLAFCCFFGRGEIEVMYGSTEGTDFVRLSGTLSMRGIQRTFGVSHPTLVAWLKKRQGQSKTRRHPHAR